MAKEKEKEQPFVLQQFETRDKTMVWNDCPELFEKVPVMKEVEYFQVCQNNYVPTRQRFGNEAQGQAEETKFIKTTGTHTISGNFTITHGSRNHKICAWLTSRESGPEPLSLTISGDEGGRLVLHKNNEIHQRMWVAMMLSPQNENNILGLKNFGDTQYLYYHLDPEADLQAKVDAREKRRAADREYEKIESDEDLLYVLAYSMVPADPYNGPKNRNMLIDYMAPFVDNKPDLVMEKIAELDANRVKVDIKDALDAGIIQNDKNAYAFIFAKEEGSKRGIISYLETDSENRQLQILQQFMAGTQGAAAKAIMRKALESRAD